MPILDVDPLTGAVETMKYDHEHKQLVITRTADISSVRDANVASYNDSGQNWRGDKNDMWHVARVPIDQLYIWLQQFNAIRPQDAQVQSPYVNNSEWQDFLWLQLHSSDNRKFKTAPVHV